MLHNWKRWLCAVLALACLLTLAACSGDRRKPGTDITVPMKDEPILPVPPETEGVVRTPVYATAFGDTVLLATYPVLKWDDFEEPECSPRQIAQGGKILCGGAHETETPIVKVMILEPLAPDSTAEWFSGMTSLSLVEGMELVDPQFVTDMTDMFKDCLALAERPTWYTE